MFFQQKLGGTPGADPRQSKIMSFMPIMFTFFFYGFASGLVLYWLWNNVLTIAQQYMISKKRNDTGEKIEPQIREIGTNKKKKQKRNTGGLRSKLR